ncbi:hypothetical protein EDD18DRAFT_1459774 [Armillaria luteobubalina]|uniref:Uncharacterized protein n=1 Tax=Armillaria luteobubalina TaxID=153913 RepID=A0AA39UW14_9AGAR|nr:hypothetical protein EDD18DRAFT_1459774 [Armillaria luteobubalina]
MDFLIFHRDIPHLSSPLHPLLSDFKMEFRMPILAAHGPSINLRKLVRSVNPMAEARPTRGIQRTFSATKTTKVAKHTDSTKRPASSQRKESRVEDARAALRRRRLRINLNRKLPAANPEFQPKNPVPTRIFKPNDHIEECIASLNSNHLFIFAAHRNQQAFDRNSRRMAIRKRNAEMNEHDRTADKLRQKRALDEEKKREEQEADEQKKREEQEAAEKKKRELARMMAPVDERYRLIRQPGYFDQLNVEQERARPHESSSSVDWAAVFTETINNLAGLRRQYAAVQGPDNEIALIHWAETHFHMLQFEAMKKGGTCAAAIQYQYQDKWNRFITQSTSEPIGGTRFYTFPWPSLMFATTLDDITEFRVRYFFLNPEGYLANRIDVLEEELVKWHPRNLSKVLHLVTEQDRESVQKGAEIVVQSIEGLLQDYA